MRRRYCTNGKASHGFGKGESDSGPAAYLECGIGNDNLVSQYWARGVDGIIYAGGAAATDITYHIGN